MENLLLSKPAYKIEETAFGTWKRFLYPSGLSYAEFTARRRLFGLPLIHYTSGVCPETGRRRAAKGILAIGRVAFGLCAIGQASFGVIAIGQAAVGLLFSLGQLATGLAAIGQLSIGAVAIGQVAIGVVAIGQIGIGLYVLAQRALGWHIWDTWHSHPSLQEWLGQLPFRQ